MVKVGILMGSDSDLPIMQKAAQMLEKSGYAHYLTEEKRASSNTLSSYLRDVNQYLHWLAGEELLPEQAEQRIFRECVPHYLICR